MSLGAACGTREVTSQSAYSNFIGARYSVVSDDLYAYGIWKSLNERPGPLEAVYLVPMEIGGIEISFKKPVPTGQVFRIVSAWQQLPFMDTYYLVTIDNDPAGIFPAGVPVKLELMRGNEGEGAGLNPRIYERLPDRP